MALLLVYDSGPKKGRKMVRFWWKLVFLISTLQTKNAPNIIKIGRFLIAKLVPLKIEKLSDFDKIWCVFGLKCGDYKYQFSSKSDNFSAIFWPWIINQEECHPKFLIFFFTHWNARCELWKNYNLIMRKRQKENK